MIILNIFQKLKIFWGTLPSSRTRAILLQNIPRTSIENCNSMVQPHLPHFTTASPHSLFFTVQKLVSPHSILKLHSPHFDISQKLQSPHSPHFNSSPNLPRHFTSEHTRVQENCTQSHLTRLTALAALHSPHCTHLTRLTALASLQK